MFSEDVGEVGLSDCELFEGLLLLTSVGVILSRRVCAWEMVVASDCLCASDGECIVGHA